MKSLTTIVLALAGLCGACTTPARDDAPDAPTAAYAVLSDEAWTLLAADARHLTYRVDPASQARLAPGVVIIHRDPRGAHALRLVTGVGQPDPTGDPAVVALEVTAISAYKVFARVAVDVDEAVPLAVARDSLALGDSGITLRGVTLTSQQRLTATISTDNASAYGLEGPVTRFAQEVDATLTAGAAQAEPQTVPLDVPVLSVPFRRDVQVMFEDRVETVPFFGTIEVEVAGQYRVDAPAGHLAAQLDCAVDALAQRVTWADAWASDKELDGRCVVAPTPSAPAAAAVEAGLRLRYRVKIYDFVAPTFEQFLGTKIESADGTPRARGWARTTFHMEHLPIGAAPATQPPLQTKPVAILDEPIKPLVHHGFVSRPGSDAAPQGWGAPHADPAGTPINPPLGTVGGATPFNLLWQRSAMATWVVTRDLEGVGPGHDAGYGNLDWVYVRDGALAGYLSWKGPHGRNVPEQPIAITGAPLRGVRLGDYVNVTSGGSHYYVYRGTKVFLDGQVLYDFGGVGFVSGAAIRHVGDRRYLLAATTNFAEDVDRLWSIELDVPTPTAVAAGVVALPDGYAWDRSARANSYFCNQSATRCASIIQASHETSTTFTASDTENGVTVPGGGASTATTTVPLRCTVDWTTPTMAVSGCVAPAEPPWTTTSDSTFERVPMSGGRFQYDSVRTEAYAAAATAVAVDYVGDQEVRLDRSMSLSQSSTHHDVSMVPDSMFHDVVNEVRVDQYDGPGWSVTGGATLSSDESMTVNYPAETCSYARTSDEATVEHDLLYVDLRHGEYLYVERRHGRVDSGTATNPGVSCAGAATATTTVETALYHNGTMLAHAADTTPWSGALVATEDYFWRNNHSGGYFDTGIISASSHRQHQGVAGLLIPQYAGFPLVDPTSGSTVGTFRGAPEFATSAAGTSFFSLALPTLGSMGMIEPIVHHNRFAGLADPAGSIFELQGADPRFDYLGVW
ncbi:MAG: hypothetical protein KA201_28610 [Kofleriaceae bacterium]|nr:hypothetical protein [Kofleriaceae bacterium]